MKTEPRLFPKNLFPPRILPAMGSLGGRYTGEVVDAGGTLLQASALAIGVNMQARMRSVVL